MTRGRDKIIRAKSIQTGNFISALLAVAVLIAAILTIITPALANGGGSSSGGLPATQSGPQIDPAQSYREGLEALQAGDYKTAEKRFNEVLTVARKMPEANYYMGVTKVRLGKEKASVRYFKRAIKALPNFVEAREQLALVQISIDKADKAAEQLAALKEIDAECTANGCDDVVAASAKQAIATVEAALSAAGEGEGDDVSTLTHGDHFAQLIFEPREAGVTRYMDAVKLINQERFAEAIDDLYGAQKIVGPHPDILNYLGYTHRKLNRFDEAKEYYGAALALAPDHLGANEYLGELYLELGEIDKAKRQLAKLERLCAFGCAEREDLARLIAIRTSDRHAARE